MKNRIKIIRKELKITQLEFANLLGLSQNYITLIEHGKRNLSERAVIDVCRVFNVRYDWLKYGTGDIFDSPLVYDYMNLQKILDNKHDPVNKIIIAAARAYQNTDCRTRESIKSFCKEIENEIKNI